MRSWASLPVFALRATPRHGGKSGAVFSGAGEVGGGRARVVFDSVASLCRGSVPSACFARCARLPRFAKSQLPYRIPILQR